MSKKEYETIIWAPKKWAYRIWVSDNNSVPETHDWCVATSLDDFKTLLDKYGHAQTYSFGEDGLKEPCLSFIKEKFDGQAATYEQH